LGEDNLLQGKSKIKRGINKVKRREGMKITCNVVKDLLPLYVDDLTSEDSTNIIEEHAKECTNCKELIATLKTEIEVPEVNMQLSNNSYKKLFKKIRNRIISFISIALVIGVLVGIFGGSFMDGRRSQASAKKFFKSLAQQNYEQAFEYVHYYDVSSDLTPQISYNRAKSIWIDRVKALKDKGIYVKGYKDLSVRLDDTYPVGTVSLIIVEEGQEKIVNMNIWFSSTLEKWKVGSLYEKVSPETEIEKAISGYIEDK
jgi:hypothetical protein